LGGKLSAALLRPSKAGDRRMVARVLSWRKVMKPVIGEKLSAKPSLLGCPWLLLEKVPAVS
jgi:hypothetical protein